MTKNRIIVQFAHPAYHKSRINKALINSIEGIKSITINKLYDKYPDFHIDSKREQKLLDDHDYIVWHHPFYWYSSPSLLKEWFDLVLEHNWAYGKKGNALKGKVAFSVISTGGSKAAYTETGDNNCTMMQFLKPFQRSANLCKMSYLPPFVVHGTHLLSKEGIDEYANQYKSLLIALRDGIFNLNELQSCGYLNDLIDSK